MVYRTVDWEDRKRTTLELARELGPKINALPGVNAFIITPPSLGQGFRERPLNFVIQTSDSYENLNRVVRQMLDEIAKNPGIVCARRRPAPEQAGAAHRRRPREGGRHGRERGRGGQGAGDHAGRAHRDALQARRRAVRRDRADRRPAGRTTPEDIDGINVRGRNDTMIPLSALVKVRESVSPRELNHFGQRRSASITANLSPDYSLGQALQFMDETAAKVLKPGYTTDLNGTSREFRNSQGALAIVFVLALLFIFLVLAAQFESFVDPLRDHAVGAAVDDRRAAGAQVVAAGR